MQRIKDRVEDILYQLLNAKKTSVIADINASRCGTDWDWKKANERTEELEKVYDKAVEDLCNLIGEKRD